MYGWLAGTFGSSIDAPSASAPAEFSTGDIYSSFIQVIVVLAVVIGLIVVLIRFLASRNKRWSGRRSLQVHAGVPLGQNKSLQVVEIGDAVYIVGVGEDITLLDKIDDPERVEALIASIEIQSSPAPGKSFAAVAEAIRNLRRKQAGPYEEETEWQSQAAFKDLLSQKLKASNSRKEAMKEWMGEDER